MVSTEDFAAANAVNLPWLTPISLGSLNLKNRVVMAPMTRCRSPGGVPGADVAVYYQRRARAGVGLIISEGTLVPHPGAQNDPSVPRFYGKEAIDGWRKVLAAVRLSGARMFPQLWHPGLIETPQVEHLYRAKLTPSDYPIPMPSPSGMLAPHNRAGNPMAEREIEEVVSAFGAAAATAKEIGFDGIELHGAHGYLIDQFLWSGTNLRTDRFGGNVSARLLFAAEIVRECRRQTADNFPISLRLSQWKQQDYAAKLADSPIVLERLLSPLADAGVDIFHCSTRRFWDAEFPGENLNFAEWTKKLTGKPVITVGSIGLGDRSEMQILRDLDAMWRRGYVDLIAVGRALIADPERLMRLLADKELSMEAYRNDMLRDLI